MKAQGSEVTGPRLRDRKQWNRPALRLVVPTQKKLLSRLEFREGTYHAESGIVFAELVFLPSHL